ncbi:hypothetical protein NPIL_275281 [Nephila pilipes]|uniref:Uncharacterized protein n=1 Tax=Nephila pilipes TaxID=299642 RepID=A0A8X6UTI6_NEPPI|nr:hypothetical protein NPIL_275281 [Nephila pilipes]
MFALVATSLFQVQFLFPTVCKAVVPLSVSAERANSRKVSDADMVKPIEASESADKNVSPILLDNIHQQYFKLFSDRTQTDNSSGEATKTSIYLQTPNHKFIKHHRKKHLRKRKKTKFQPKLSTIEEIDETIEPTYNDAQNIKKLNSPTLAIPNPIPQSASSITLSNPTSDKQKLAAIPSPSTSFKEMFKNKSFIIPDLIVQSETTPTNINENFAEQYYKYVEQKRKHKKLPFLKRKFQSLKKKILKKK